MCSRQKGGAEAKHYEARDNTTSLGPSLESTCNELEAKKAELEAGKRMEEDLSTQFSVIAHLLRGLRKRGRYIG